jgi:hypothetical protein
MVLGPVHREVGHPHELIARLVRRAGNGHADAGRHRRRLAIEAHRPADRLEQPADEQ